MANKRRAIVVCSACHKRKIKCDVQPWTDHFQALRPCSACLERGTECRLRSRKPYTSRVRNHNHVEADRSRKLPVLDVAHAPKTVSFHIDRAEVTASVGSHPDSRQTSSLYFGESGYGSLLDIVNPPSHSSKGRHLTISSSRDSTLPAEDLAYLEAKGCFALPDESHDLLRAYFRFVHPQFPVLDGGTFLRDHADGRLEKINLLLLWSMFSVSACYVPACRSVETKALYHIRAKTLFDISGENDKYVLIQSALLLSFFFDDVEDVKQSWYWTGIAFSLAQSLGLHDNLLSDRDNSTTNNVFQKTMWHCCMLRDAWLSYSMGRPLRLGGETSHTFKSECSFQDMILLGDRIHTDAEAEELTRMWRGSVEAALALHLSLQSKPVPVDKLLSQWENEQVPDPEMFTPAVTLCHRHLQLCQHATLIAICQLHEKSGSRSESSQTDIIDIAEEGITFIVQSYLKDDAISCVPLMIVPLVMPALLVSMAELKSPEKARRERAAGHLSSHLALLGAIEHSFPAASIVKRLFGTASQHILTDQSAVPD
ncbi:hypothetical protein M409DRAFT_24057 [Zasmidium cellare ATCC 36951]|uniref:Zn(2)-C6 fungal-type domain-containing protein n=1 Tax=Zasmidium cellare ATCC 36951 TaxID=1080233 RepID=A0A6A6CFC9_ZASCE|nr:uncharacterized protein M409DRAFT_24057 [Zasmidium cellare ATCC 36951]KAF2165771.1 hypothetical protein M409DRAFT_24057 [Zasmidium cellare ATCC 36951]